MFETELYRDIKMKSGFVMKKGTKVKVIPTKDDTRCNLFYEGLYYHVSYPAIFPPPTDFEHAEMAFDGDCLSVAGNGPIEPDGHDSEGFPSWLLALGMI